MICVNITCNELSYYVLYCLLTKHIVNKNADYKMLIKIPWNTKYCFEFVILIPYTESKILITDTAQHYWLVANYISRPYRLSVMGYHIHHPVNNP